MLLKNDNFFIYVMKASNYHGKNERRGIWFDFVLKNEKQIKEKKWKEKTMGPETA